eukprot:CAMPEP_0195105990 /NCGR_PEP_ID=MMETSP0448-20130528/78861_1 /TAXON_ID=66468 /ORGANISM="Heterocapsa triquestra, Strain CCMP 448" /LENGTH=149 /DNA_ID=CAMNT_0040142135 /DNA_START=80 /DNA_END=530 /DNA_ORIENTATION=-
MAAAGCDSGVCRCLRHLNSKLASSSAASAGPRDLARSQSVAQAAQASGSHGTLLLSMQVAQEAFVLVWLHALLVDELRHRVWHIFQQAFPVAHVMLIVQVEMPCEACPQQLRERDEDPDGCGQKLERQCTPHEWDNDGRDVHDAIHRAG